MRKKTRGSHTRRNRQASTKTRAAVTAPAEQVNPVTHPPAVTHLEFPPPEYLLEKARGEPNRKLVQDYIYAIRVLRDDKGFTFREIADWLTEHGVETDHNTVYRAYTRGMSEMEVAQLDHMTDQEEREG